MRIINTKIDIKHSENSKKDGKKPEIAKKIVPLQLKYTTKNMAKKIIIYNINNFSNIL